MIDSVIAVFDQFADKLSDVLDDRHRRFFLDDHQSGRDPAELGRHAVQQGGLIGPLEDQRHRVLDAGQIHNTFAHHRLRHLLEFAVGRLRLGLVPTAIGGPDQVKQFLLEMVLHVKQRRRHVEQYGFLDRLTRVDDPLEFAPLVPDRFPQFAEPEHAQRISYLLQQLDLGSQLLDVLHPGAHVNVEHVLHARQVVPNGLGDGSHQARAWRGQALARLLDLVIARYEVRQVEGRANRAHAGPGRSGARDVIEQVINELRRWLFRVALLADRRQPLHLAVGLPHQALQGHAGLKSPIQKRLDDATDHPP